MCAYTYSGAATLNVSRRSLALSSLKMSNQRHRVWMTFLVIVELENSVYGIDDDPSNAKDGNVPCGFNLSGLTLFAMTHRLTYDL